MRVLAVVDALPARGEADRLLDVVRPRLALLRPPRPFSFARLLFLPLGRTLVDTAVWCAGGRSPLLPRAAPALLAASVRAALGAEAVAVGTACAGRTMDDAEAVTALGVRLWHMAAMVAPRLTLPVGWEEAGLRCGDFPVLVALCAEAWRRGPGHTA